MTRAPITTHVLNLESGRPAAGLYVYLYRRDHESPLATAATDSDGRISQWDAGFQLQVGDYRLRFAVGEWFARQQQNTFYPEVNICFHVQNTGEHYHVPLLLNAHGYSTYRGS